jgi:hypothetical protein
MDWATFWATFSQKHLVTLCVGPQTHQLTLFCRKIIKAVILHSGRTQTLHRGILLQIGNAGPEIGAVLDYGFLIF